MVSVNNRTKSSINLGLVKKIAAAFLKKYRKTGFDLSIAFVGDKTIRNLNNRYLKKDSVTDVLAFPGDEGFFGEIIINYAQVKRQSKHYSKSVKDELVFVLVHGLYHLYGYGDRSKEEKDRMDKLSKKFIKELDFI
ncbi:MAG: rRNA maturation RNase YbeY [Phycisphaerales bacterium]|jgi:probable rRNA maturation factor